MNRLAALLAVGFSLSVFPHQVLAQENLSIEGIAGHFDKQRRGPVLTVNASAENNEGKILADAYVPFEELNKFPIRFEFYINGELKSSQLRSPELNRAVGLVVPSTMATIPFNYQVVATLLTPNRVYPSVIQGAVYAQSIGATLACTASLVSDDITKSFTNEAVSFVQSSTDSVDVTFDAKSVEDENLAIAGSLSITDSKTVNGSLLTTFDSTTVNRTVEGEVTKDGSTITTLNATDSNGFTLECEKAAQTQ